MNKYGRPMRAGQVMRQAGAVATAVKTKDGLRWQVRRERDGLMAHTTHWAPS